MIRILIAEASAEIQDGLSSVLNSTPGFHVIGVASTGLETVSLANELVPDIVIIDPYLSGIDGIETTSRIKRSMPDVAVLILSDLADHIESGLAAGAEGYLSKDCDCEELIARVSEISG